MSKLKILIVDDEQRITDELCEYLARQGFTISSANSAGTAFPLLKTTHFDILILDIRLPGMDGIEILKQVKREHPQLEVIMISGHGDMETVIQAMRLGAFDYLKKPFRQSEIKAAIERSSKYLAWQKEHKLQDNAADLIPQSLSELIQMPVIGSSEALKAVLKAGMDYAGFKDTPVIITGESGTGKEIVARIIHYASSRKDKNFIPINCSALPEQLLESEFFGYQKGAFTGATQDKKGILELASGGTIFLDEIGDMPPPLQAKLLRVLEEKKFRKLGSSVETSIDLRFVAATNRNLEEDIAAQRFRADLYYRLAACKIHIPALRERSEDIQELLRHFATSFCQTNNIRMPELDPILIDEIQHYDFPGNVRELKNMVERAIITNQDGILDKDDFPVLQAKATQGITALDAKMIQEIQKALATCDHNQSAAAKLLGISRYTLMRKLKKFNIQS
ncbi:MAG: sigma-54 dependent transcriptional regulator [Candidatus Cloacimonadaceae bacterium]|jgi:DNA-binding NtrC family response regulator|nr:sigma-54 dependent transcriptional regulator [Candidatus Cloacimonadota bacterium]MDY0128179.1 sigma-54 dependent transcriptional regulator [Candidatus Cloacimonadaceae bacterium]MCB5255146.1 sigma-54 dependent transcriptional regulator [Candidatus Cloacimonadota bacterium]MCK9178976.1 sigma-54 dependent transcriptional regulator [Candidatus Cloacimonadota bacterium]MCK9243320.1 sigma-54 dependent transcriptional regulator [Candidatus Cloacimonadota bacterium]